LIQQKDTHQETTAYNSLENEYNLKKVEIENIFNHLKKDVERSLAVRSNIQNSASFLQTISLIQPAEG
jgi:hypothetical protein